MGEYAIRISDGQEVKIGTCEQMYYLRFEDRAKVRHLSGNVDPNSDRECGELRFRIPFPDEDDVQIGTYEHYDRGLRLWRRSTCEWCKGSGKSTFASEPECRHCHGSGFDGGEDFIDKEKDTEPGTIQLSHRPGGDVYGGSGLLLSVSCYHGIKLPEGSKDISPFWNGKSPCFELRSLRGVFDGALRLTLWPVVGCRYCGQQWRYEWRTIWEYVPDDMKPRLEVYKNQIESVAEL